MQNICNTEKRKPITSLHICYHVCLFSNLFQIFSEDCFFKYVLVSQTDSIYRVTSVKPSGDNFRSKTLLGSYNVVLR